jgi:sugar lactone lactonase YvrE
MPFEWHFDRHVSAAGWIDTEHLLIASETGLSRFNLETQEDVMICPIEADNDLTRSNDGRADPWGGFWMGTMSKAGDPNMGTLYRWYHGELRPLIKDMSTPNALCFDHARGCAYYADTKTRIIWRQPLEVDTGWPIGAPEIFVDLRATETQPEYKPDGAIIDADGCLWSAQWAAARVARYSTEGVFMTAIDLPTGHTSCPAFGGDDGTTLFVTTAQQKLPAGRPDWSPTAGQTFAIATGIRGVREPSVHIANASSNVYIFDKRSS